MNENIDLFEILKDCPENTEFYCSEIDENVKFKSIEKSSFDGIIFMPDDPYSIVNEDSVRYDICVNRYGSMFSKGKTSIIFPSKNQRDWSKWECHGPKFNPKTLQSFDKVLVRNSPIDKWYCTFLSHLRDNKDYPFFTTDSCTIKYCIPYNDETKHLVCTSEEAPEYYRYWED